MEEIIFEGQIYYFANGIFVDSNFLTLPQTLNEKVANAYFGAMDYKSFSCEQLKTFIKQAKSGGAYEIAEKACEQYVDAYGEDFYLVNGILATYASLLRSNHKPQKAIDLYNRFFKHDKCSSSHFLTSIAAAYCDLRDKENALRFARRAYACQGGSAGYTNELSLVFARICKEFNISQDDLR